MFRRCGRRGRAFPVDEFQGGSRPRATTVVEEGRDAPRAGPEPHRGRVAACACWAGGAVETGAAPPPVGRRAVASFVDSLTGSPPVGTGRRPRRGRTRMRPPRRCPLFPRRRPPSEPPPQCGGVAELPASPFILFNLMR